MELYAIITAGVTGLIGILYAMFKLKSSEAEKTKVLLKVAQQEAEQATKITKNAEKHAENLHVIKKALEAKRKAEQERIDRGERNAFDTDEF